MCNFNKQDKDTKEIIHLLVNKSAEAVGGANFLLGLIEAMKKHKPNPLMFKHCHIESENLSIKWNKAVFKDKIDLLEEILYAHKSADSQDFNILKSDSDKKSKKILNMVKALAPIKFLVTPKDEKDGVGFEFEIFELIRDDFVKINPLFVSMFFCSTEFTKKALKYVS